MSRRIRGRRRRSVLAATVVVGLSQWVGSPPASADNCSGLSDCAAGVDLAVAVVAVLLAVLAIWMIAEIVTAAAVAAEIEAAAAEAAALEEAAAAAEATAAEEAAVAEEAAAAADQGAVADEEVRTLFRADSRGPEQIFEQGFQPKGNNMDIVQHVTQNPADSGFVSTTHDLPSAQQFAQDADVDYIYQLRGSGIDVNAEFGARSPFPWENEIAVPGPVPPSAVEGVWGPDGWIINPGYLP